MKTQECSKFNTSYCLLLEFRQENTDYVHSTLFDKRMSIVSIIVPLIIPMRVKYKRTCLPAKRTNDYADFGVGNKRLT